MAAELGHRVGSANGSVARHCRVRRPPPTPRRRRAGCGRRAKPAARSHVAACWLRLPWWQTRTSVAVARQVADARRQLAERDVTRAVDAAVRRTPRARGRRRAAVPARARVGAPRGQLGGRDLRDQNANRAGAAALTQRRDHRLEQVGGRRASPAPTQRDEARGHHRRVADDREHAAAGLQLRAGTRRAAAASSR